MPELPEVETIVRTLRLGGRGGTPILGKQLREAHIFWERTVQQPSGQETRLRIKGQFVIDISRRGKFILIHLSSDVLLIHLRMSGDLRVENRLGKSGDSIPPGKTDRAIFDFEDDLRLAFEDTRKFGRIWLVKHAEEIVGSLGPEPFDPTFTPENFFLLLAARHRQLKPLLMDQHFLAGLGNIYTDEALHIARLHPLQSSDAVSREEAGRLHAAIQQVLTRGIEQNGASIDWVYRGGNFQNSFQVYQRSGEPCYSCGQPIVRIVVGQRGTHFCPRCQPF